MGHRVDGKWDMSYSEWDMSHSESPGDVVGQMLAMHLVGVGSANRVANVGVDGSISELASHTVPGGLRHARVYKEENHATARQDHERLL